MPKMMVLCSLINFFSDTGTSGSVELKYMILIDATTSLFFVQCSSHLLQSQCAETLHTACVCIAAKSFFLGLGSHVIKSSAFASHGAIIFVQVGSDVIILMVIWLQIGKLAV